MRNIQRKYVEYIVQNVRKNCPEMKNIMKKKNRLKKKIFERWKNVSSVYYTKIKNDLKWKNLKLEKVKKK